MILVVDGFNLIYKFPDLELYMYENNLIDARKGLFQKLLLFKKLKKIKEVHVFLDGKKEFGSPVEFEDLGSMYVYYSHELKADSHIKKFVRTHKSPSDLYVVTSDKEILFYSKKYNCRYYTSEEFYKLYQNFVLREDEREIETERIYKNLNEEEIQEWLKFFRKSTRGNKRGN